jgi:hypothetical protein
MPEAAKTRYANRGAMPHATAAPSSYTTVASVRHQRSRTVWRRECRRPLASLMTSQIRSTRATAPTGVAGSTGARCSCGDVTLCSDSRRQWSRRSASDRNDRRRIRRGRLPGRRKPRPPRPATHDRRRRCPRRSRTRACRRPQPACARVVHCPQRQGRRRLAPNRHHAPSNDVQLGQVVQAIVAKTIRRRYLTIPGR